MLADRVLLGGTGIGVAPIALGTMQFGHGPLAVDATTSQAIFDTYVSAGGNFIDTAPVYGEDCSAERQVGQLVKADRDSYVLATKVGAATEHGSYTGGLSRKSILRGVTASLRRLGTDYIDLLLVHAPDSRVLPTVWVPALKSLLESGKILSWGVSNMPAWQLAEAATLGWMDDAPMSVTQVQYSVASRDPELEIVPAAKRWELSLMAWGPLGGGLLAQSELHGERTLIRRGFMVSEAQQALAADLERLARARGVTAASIALAWLNTRNAIPAVGARTAAQLREALQSVTLDSETLTYLDSLSPMTPTYPTSFLELTQQFFEGRR